MNAIEIEQAVSELFSQPYDATEFPYQFLEAFGNPKTTLKRLRASESNKSDCGGVLQRNHIHILTCAPGETTTALATLQQSATNAKNKVNYLLVTDGEQINATDLQSGEPLVCDYADFPNHFGFFLGLANIRTVKAIRDSAFDIRATAKLNRLYVQLLKDNPDWAKAERRHDMNHFMARLIFCFFAEDTDIFNGDNLFSATIEQMSAADGGDLEHVIGEIFRAMNTKIENRGTANLRPWADAFPYVNGGLFSDAPAVPRFNKTTRAYLLQIGLLDWTKINPDIFGSMIQAVADEEERGELGMHYTSVPNILKVLNPLFLVPNSPTRAATKSNCSTCANALPASACLTPPAAVATFSSSPTAKCARLKTKSTNSAAKKAAKATSPSPTSEASSCAISPPKSPASPSSSPSIRPT